MVNAPSAPRRLSVSLAFYKALAPPWLIVAYALGYSALIERNMAWLMLSVGVAAGWVFYCRYVFTLADEVLDYGDHLMVRKGRLTEKVPLASILAVHEHLADKYPKRVDLHVAAPSRLAPWVTFLVEDSYGLQHTTSPLTRDLLERVRQAQDRR